MNTVEKNAALTIVAGGKTFIPVGRAKYRIDTRLVHVRYCSTSAISPEKYKFNINPNTLSADFELWICGNAGIYYLMPISFMREIYDNPDTYVDRMHPEIRVVSVNTQAHEVTYASGGVSSSLQHYLGATIS